MRPAPQNPPRQRERAASEPPRTTSAVPRSIEEAERISQQEGRTYDFWGDPNVYAPLGLYTSPRTGAALTVCFTCKSPGHLNRDCIAAALLRLNNKIIRDGHIVDRMKPPSESWLQETREKWGSFMNGNNSLKRKISTSEDLDEYFRSQRSPTLQERITLSDDYFGKRPRKTTDRPRWTPGNGGENVTSTPAITIPDWSGQDLLTAVSLAENV